MNDILRYHKLNREKAVPLVGLTDVCCLTVKKAKHYQNYTIFWITVRLRDTVDHAKYYYIP